jgi:glycine betaine/proline transport system ATP-binding protein
MSSTKVALRQVSKVYDQRGKGTGMRRAALDDVTLDVADGGICVLMGLSGCGKSTLLRLMNGLIAPTAGQVLVDGQDLGRLKARELQRLRRDGMAMVFQSFALLPHRTVLDNAAFGLELAGVARAERVRRAGAVLEQVGLNAHGDCYPHELSGGMRQRVGLARALAVDPALLLMDEAFSALDPLTRRGMQDLLLDLQRERRRTIVFVSHDVEEALHLGDSIALLHEGRLLQHDAPRALLAHPADAHVHGFFQGVDRARHLRAADLIDPSSVPGSSHPATGAPQQPGVAADTALSELMARLTLSNAPLSVLDASGGLLGAITAASALRAITGTGAGARSGHA